MKKIVMLFALLTFIIVSCDDAPPVNPNAERSGLTPMKKYSGDLAVKWNQLQMKISRTTAGFNSGIATRAFAYSGLTLYESIVEGIPGYQSVASGLVGQDITGHREFPVIYWPASGNAAMAEAVRSLISTTTAANLATIDSLEQAFNDQFKKEAPAIVLQNSITYGKRVAKSIFDWSKSDGVAEAAAKNSSYIIPTGPGLWEPTPPAFVFPVNVYLDEARTFVQNSPALTLTPAPIPYSEETGSDFYNQVNDVYNRSLAPTADEVTIVKTWGEFPGNYTQALRYVMIGIQLVDEADLTLDVAALAFAKHHMVLQEVAPCIFHSKYTYNQMRPITYIRNVMGHNTWNSLNTTPPHPEYPAAHASTGRASSRVLESIFGQNYAFTDKTHASLYGTRSYNSFKEYSDEAGWSRVLGGIHYYPSVVAGTVQGEKVGDLINSLPFKAGPK